MLKNLGVNIFSNGATAVVQLLQLLLDQVMLADYTLLSCPAALNYYKPLSCSWLSSQDHCLDCTLTLLRTATQLLATRKCCLL